MLLRDKLCQELSEVQPVVMCTQCSYVLLKVLSLDSQNYGEFGRNLSQDTGIVMVTSICLQTFLFILVERRADSYWNYKITKLS